MEEGGMGPSPAPPRQGPCWESMAVQRGGPVAAPQPAPPPHLLPVFHPEPRWEGRAARPAADESKPTPGQQRGPSAGGGTELWLRNQRPKSQRGPAAARSAPGRRTVPIPACLPAPTAQPAPRCAQFLGQAETASPCRTPGGLRGPQTAGSPRRAEGLGEKGADVRLQKREREAAACRSRRVPQVQK